MGRLNRFSTFWRWLSGAVGQGSRRLQIGGELEMLAEQRQISVPTRVRVDGPFDLLFHQLPEHQLRLSASTQAQLEGVTTDVRRGTLVIEVDPRAQGAFDAEARVVVGIAAPLITSVAASGHSSIRLSDVDLDELEIQGADTSEVWVGGRCRGLSVTGTGWTSIDCEALVASRVDCQISDKGSCRAFALDSIRARVSGRASLTIGGHPSREEVAVEDEGYVSRLRGAAS